MDLDGRHELSPGEEGELWLRGPTVAEGYWCNEEGTRQAFLDDGWYRTGDMGAISGKGNLRVVGRKNVSIHSLGAGNRFFPRAKSFQYRVRKMGCSRSQDLIFTGNRHVLPLQMERVILSHPDVREAVVCGVENRSNGSNESDTAPKSQLLRAYVIRKEKSSLDEAGIVGHIKQNADEVDQLSIDGGVVFLDRIPRTTVRSPAKSDLQLKADTPV